MNLFAVIRSMKNLRFGNLFSRLWQILGILFALCVFVNVMVILGYSSNPLVNIGHYQGTVFMVNKNSEGGKNASAASAVSSPQTTIHSTHNEMRPNTAKATSINTTVINPHSFEYIINEPDTCKNSPELIIVVCTSVANFRERSAVRETWVSVVQNVSKKVKVIFLLGATESADLQQKLDNESKKFHDIVQENFKDSYQNLSLKSVALLKWVGSYCNSSKYVLKTDDDMYINIPNLLQALRQQTRSKFILGFIFVGARPIQDPKSKWYTPKEHFSENMYPKYTSGTAYSMSTSAVHDLYKASLQLKTFWLEDIYITGLCARKAGIPQFHHGGFSYARRPPTGCVFRSAITGHRYSVDDLYKIHRELSDPKLKC